MGAQHGEPARHANRAVFVDPTGRRRRRLHALGWCMALAVAVYLGLVVVSLASRPGLLPLSLPGLGRLLPNPAAPPLTRQTPGVVPTPNPARSGSAASASATGGVPGAPAIDAGKRAATPPVALSTPPSPARTATPSLAPTPTRTPTPTPTPVPSRTHGTGKPTAQPTNTRRHSTGKPSPKPKHTALQLQESGP